jgi:hypothetical protein
MNKYERKLLNHKKESRHNKLWVGIYTQEDNKYEKTKSLSYSTKVKQRDRLKLEREVDVWESIETTTTTRT